MLAAEGGGCSPIKLGTSISDITIDRLRKNVKNIFWFNPHQNDFLGPPVYTWENGNIFIYTKDIFDGSKSMGRVATCDAALA